MQTAASSPDLEFLLILFGEHERHKRRGAFDCLHSCFSPTLTAFGTALDKVVGNVSEEGLSKYEVTEFILSKFGRHDICLISSRLLSSLASVVLSCALNYIVDHIPYFIHGVRETLHDPHKSIVPLYAVWRSWIPRRGQIIGAGLDLRVKSS